MARVNNAGPRVAKPVLKGISAAELKQAAATFTEESPTAAQGWQPKPQAARVQGPQSVTAPLTPWDVNDHHLPSLNEFFARAAQYPGKTIFLDTKLPPGKPEVAQRMAQQYLEAFRQYPQLKAQAFISVPNAEMLKVVQDEFAKAPGFSDFKNFCYDHEQLNQSVLKSTDAVQTAADPLSGSGDNRFIAVGDPKAPFRQAGFNDLKEVVKRALEKTRDPQSPEFGKQLCVWTINDEKKMRELAQLKPDFILTDNPDLLKKVLDDLYPADEPNRPKIMCHRGGPAGFAPMNTMPMVDEGFRRGDAIEIDVCSAKDGAILFHDNNPKDIVSALHGQAIDQTGFRTTMPNVLSKERTKRLDELTVDEIRGAYTYTPAKQPKTGAGRTALGVTRTAGTIGNWAVSNVQRAGEGIGRFFKKIF